LGTWVVVVRQNIPVLLNTRPLLGRKGGKEEKVLSRCMVWKPTGTEGEGGACFPPTNLHFLGNKKGRRSSVKSVRFGRQNKGEGRDPESVAGVL